MRFHKLQNVQIALDFLRHRQVKYIIFNLRNIESVCPITFKLLFFVCFLFCFCFFLQVKLVNIRNDDIADGNPKLTLGLIWTIILHFQVSSAVSVVFYYFIAPPSLGSAHIICLFPTLWNQSEWTSFCHTALREFTVSPYSILITIREVTIPY